MRITTVIKSLFLSIVFFSSLVQAQIPDKIRFNIFQYFPAGIFYDAYYSPLLSLDNSSFQQEVEFQWGELVKVCKYKGVLNQCELKVNSNYVDGIPGYGFYKFFINTQSGSIKYAGYFNYPESSRDRGSLSHDYYKLNTPDFNGELVQSINLLPKQSARANYMPLYTVNKTSNSFLSKETFNNMPAQDKDSFPITPSFSIVPSVFLSGGVNYFSYIGGGDVHIHQYSETSDLSSEVGIFHVTCSMIDYNITCSSSISNIPGSGYIIYYQNRVLEINYAPPSLSVIPNQTITANKPFSLDLRNYLSKIVDGAPKVTMTVTPSDVAGLHFDADNMSLTGRPSSTGSYQFTVNAKSTLGEAAPITFMVHIGVNQDDKPEWKPMAELPGATVEVSYDFDMNRLLAHAAGVVEFKIAESFPHPEWLRIENSHLVGTPTANDAGTTQQVTLFAESPTGGSATNAQGDPEPLTLSIPIQQDGRLRPVMQSGDKTVGANESIRFDLRNLVNDPTNDPNLQIVLDKVEPANDQLKLAINQSTVLEGLMPGDTPGQTFKLTLHAHNSQGGDSELAVVNLKVETNPIYKPRLNPSTPTMPFLIPGTSYYYDFKSTHSIWPENIPFTITFAEGHKKPSWLNLNNNRLTAERIPDDLNGDIKVYIVIENIPGGKSEVIPLSILIPSNTFGHSVKLVQSLTEVQYESEKSKKGSHSGV